MATDGQVMISLNGVSKRFPNARRPAVTDLSLEVAAGETVVLVGPSGCGKTTTMRMINRLIEPTSGTILVDGKDVMRQNPVQLRRGIGYVIQSIGLLPHRTVAQNIATVPNLVGWEDRRIKARVEELMGIFGLDLEMAARYPGELSGGQRQRVGVARALAVDPPVMLMDEPFAAVDPIVRARLQDQFLDIQRRLKKTIVFVTHDIDEAIKMADRIAILNVGGVIEQYAPPEEILRAPANRFVEEFVGAERGLKRLALISVSDIGVDEGPVVDRSASAEEARAVMKRFGLDWATVVDDGRLLGWVDRASLDEQAAVGEATPRKFSAYVRSDSSLREALDSIVTSRTNVAVVAGDDDRYLGILTVERISREIVS
jgi:osmoprotectant transport system ATP-binding protein